MSEQTSPPRPRAARPSLRAAVLNVALVATVAAALVWSALFVDLARKRDQAAAAPAPRTQGANPGPGQAAQTPAPVTTRTS